MVSEQVSQQGSFLRAKCPKPQGKVSFSMIGIQVTCWCIPLVGVVSADRRGSFGSPLHQIKGY